jgi:hypothetical protein
LGDLKATKQNKQTTLLNNRLKSEWNLYDQKSYSYIRGTLSPLEKGNITFLPGLHGIPNFTTHFPTRKQSYHYVDVGAVGDKSIIHQYMSEHSP